MFALQETLTLTSNSRSLYVAELCPLNLKPAVSLKRSIANLVAYIFTFPIAICPNEKSSGVASLLLDVHSNGGIVLHIRVKYDDQSKEVGQQTGMIAVKTGASNKQTGGG